MSLECTIAGVSQELSFEENVTTTFLTLCLPNGEHIRAAIDEDAAGKVVALSIALSGQPKAAMQKSEFIEPPPPPRSAPVDEIGSDLPVDYIPQRGLAQEVEPRIFGGQDGGEEPSPDYAEPPPAKPNVQRLANGRVVIPQRTVARNAYGYPIVNHGGVDPDTLTAHENPDEDGVGSV